jgi:hypothetical protein
MGPIPIRAGGEPGRLSEQQIRIIGRRVSEFVCDLLREQSGMATPAEKRVRKDQRVWRLTQAAADAVEASARELGMDEFAGRADELSGRVVRDAIGLLPISFKTVKSLAKVVKMDADSMAIPIEP